MVTLGSWVPRGWSVHWLPCVRRIRISSVRHGLPVALVYPLLYTGAGILWSDPTRRGLVANGRQLALDARCVALRGGGGLASLAGLAVNGRWTAGGSLAIFFGLACSVFFLLPRLPLLSDFLKFYKTKTDS